MKYKWHKAICIVWASWEGSAVKAASKPVVVVPKNTKLFICNFCYKPEFTMDQYWETQEKWDQGLRDFYYKTCV